MPWVWVFLPFGFFPTPSVFYPAWAVPSASHFNRILVAKISSYKMPQGWLATLQKDSTVLMSLVMSLPTPCPQRRNLRSEQTKEGVYTKSGAGAGASAREAVSRPPRSPEGAAFQIQFRVRL